MTMFVQIPLRIHCWQLKVQYYSNNDLFAPSTAVQWIPITVSFHRLLFIQQCALTVRMFNIAFRNVKLLSLLVKGIGSI